jgi:hypothetical protein
MRILSFVILIVVLYLSNQKTESPHGSAFKVSCKTCHSAKGWQLDKEIYSFDHNRTKLPLTGSHNGVNCRLCHISLVFSEAKSECYQCHKDIHQNTVGLDCARCHTPASWLVNNIEALHRTSRFPLMGAHKTADCIQCHKSESYARYDVQGVLCIDCHREDYMATTNPNHVLSGMSEDCSTCHPVNSVQWTGTGFNHNFFPLTQAHSSIKCTDCHTTGNYSEAKPDCYSCHQTDYNATVNPNHKTANYPTNCAQCHSTNPGWKPATLNHSKFPLTLGHAIPNCTDCHKNGIYTSTPTDCYACHVTDYNNSVNPGHKALAFSNQCTQCHTTNPGWKPASYTQHDAQMFPIYTGRHKGTWTLCSECHTNPANYKLFDCKRCHANEHSGKNYTNAQCYACHPRGTGG